VLLAVAMDAAVGDPPDRWHPVAWMGAAFGRGRARLAAGSAAWLLASGGALTLGVALAAALVAWGIAQAAARLGPAGVVVDAVALWSLLAVRGLGAAALAAADALDRGDLAGARARVGRDLVSRPTATLDDAHVASAAVESVAENLTDSVVAPLLFYALLGLPGAAFYRAVNTADAMIGYRDGVLEHFGKVAARLDDVLNLVPARVAAAALVIAALVSGRSAHGAWTTAWRDGARTSSPNAGLTMAAMAGALGVTLEKAAHYRLGGGRAPGAADVRASVRIMRAATGLVVAGLVVALSLAR
jgi:adenosylcobinamide-phosphate synthase